jgi:hypothetical protein
LTAVNPYVGQYHLSIFYKYMTAIPPSYHSIIPLSGPLLFHPPTLLFSFLPWTVPRAFHQAPVVGNTWRISKEGAVDELWLMMIEREVRALLFGLRRWLLRVMNTP